MSENEESESRVLVLCDDVCNKTVRPLIQRIYDINIQDDKVQAVMNPDAFSREAIDVIINSYGGYVSDMFALISAIEESETPIHTHVGGVACSAGASILMVGDFRTASKYATIMIHDMSGGVYGTREDIKAQLKQEEILRKRIMDFILEHTKLTPEFLEDMMKGRKDVYFTAEEALEAGIIDAIVE